MSNQQLWLAWNSGPGHPAFNMAADEALLIHASQVGRPVLRFYGWTEAAASFGYFQEHNLVSEWTLLRPLVRRPTGGGLVPHDKDWTYSLAFPPGHEWHSLKAVESYRRVHQWLEAALSRLDVATNLALCCDPSGPGQCFAGAEQWDLLRNGRKIAGAAQRRNRLGLLIQGSVQPPPENVRREEWQSAMLETAGAQSGIRWDEWRSSPEFAETVRNLSESKYSQAAHNQKR